MDFLKDFKTNLMARKQDPRDGWIDNIQGIVDQLKSDIPDDIFERLLGNRLIELESRLGEKFESGRYGECDSLMTEFRFDSLRTIQREYQPGGLLAPVTGESECKRVADAGWFNDCKWGGFEIRAFVHGLHHSEIIREVNFRQVVTSERIIERYSDFFDALRPSGVSREHWMGQCAPERVIVECERALVRDKEFAERPFSSFSGPNVRPQ